MAVATQKKPDKMYDADLKRHIVQCNSWKFPSFRLSGESGGLLHDAILVVGSRRKLSTGVANVKAFLLY